MDILEQYEKENSQASSPLSQWESSEEYGELIRFVIRISGGRIENEKQANIVLIAFALCMFITTIIILFGGPRGSSEAFTPRGYPLPLPGISSKKQ